MSFRLCLLLGRILAQNISETNSTTTTQDNIFENEKAAAVDLPEPETATDFYESTEFDESPPGAGFRALAVFGTAALIAIVYFYFKLKRVRDRERIHYGILDDREFELRHLDEDSSDEDATLYVGTSRKPKRSRY